MDQKRSDVRRMCDSGELAVVEYSRGLGRNLFKFGQSLLPPGA